jgi:hypothetical protein
VSRQYHVDQSQTALCMIVSHHTTSSQCLLNDGIAKSRVEGVGRWSVERHNELVSRGRAEPLRCNTIFCPSHLNLVRMGKIMYGGGDFKTYVLDHKQRAIINQDEVKQSVANDRPLRPLDHAWQHT